VSVKIGNLLAPLVHISPTQIQFQVPFESPIDLLAIDLNGSSPFHGTWNIDIKPFAFSWLPVAISPETLYAVHEDFRSLVNVNSPAHITEVIHLYATGLGATTPSAASGQPGRTNPLNRTANPVQCWLNGAPQDVRFAGLAPGMYGVYQIDVALTDTTRRYQFDPFGLQLTCGIEYSISPSAYIYLPA
jgi:uncharacterized protein (TIGR03437 family)